jgi:protease I
MTRLEGARVAILVEKMHEDLELHYPRLRLLEAGASVHLVGPKADESYASKHGYPVKSTHAARDVRGKDYDCVIVPGGFSPDHMRRSREMVEFVRGAHKAGALLAAICHGPWMLCSVPESIAGKRVTCFESIQDDVRNAGAKYVEDQPAVVDLPVITSRNPDDLPDFMRAIFGALKERRPG